MMFYRLGTNIHLNTVSLYHVVIAGICSMNFYHTQVLPAQWKSFISL